MFSLDLEREYHVCKHVHVRVKIDYLRITLVHYHCVHAHVRTRDFAHVR